jgi:hypothetical protein
MWDANSYGSLGWAITTASGYITTSPAYVEFLTDCLKGRGLQIAKSVENDANCWNGETPNQQPSLMVA